MNSPALPSKFSRKSGVKSILIFLLVVSVFVVSVFLFIRFLLFLVNKPKDTSSELSLTPSVETVGQVKGLANVFDVNIEGNFNKPANFKDETSFSKQTQLLGGLITQNADADFGTGNITAGNIVYRINAGSGILVSGGQNPTISLAQQIPTIPVLSVQGKTGAIKFTTGSGITISGLQISNNDPGSAQNIFKNVAVTGQDTVVAGGNDDTLTFVQGAGITLTTDATGKSITITNANFVANDSGWGRSSTNVALTNAGDLVGIGTATPGFKLDVVGSVNAGSLYIGGVQVTATPAELNVLDGTTVSTAELNLLSGRSGVLLDNSNISTYATTGVTAGSGLAGGGTSGVLSLNVGAGDGITVLADAITLDIITAGVSSSTASNSGLELRADGLRLLGGCADSEFLSWDSASQVWKCTPATVSGGSGTTHPALSLVTSGLNFLTLNAASQILTMSAVNLTSDVSGILTAANGGTGVNSGTAPSGTLLLGNGSGFSIKNMGGDATLAADGALTLANSGVVSGSYGSTFGIPVLSVDSKGRIVSASTSALNLTFENPLTFSNGLSRATNTITVDATTTGTTSTTASNSGLEVTASGVRLLGGCATNEVLAWSSTNSTWYCSSLIGVGGLIGAGLTNYNAKFTNVNTLTAGIIYDDGVNIGIGTTNPGAKLEVAGNINARGTQHTFGNSATGKIILFPDASGMNSLIRLGNESNTWDLYSTSGALAFYDRTNSRYTLVSNSNADFAVGNVIDPSTLTGANFIVKGNGKVGIGTTNPVEALDVYSGSTAMFRTNGTSGVYIRDALQFFGAPTSFNVYWDGVGYGGRFYGTGGEAFRYDHLGNFGIGTTAPSYKLDVNGDIRAASGSDFYKGSIALGGTGSSSSTSGAYVIGSYDEFTYSNSSTVQGVLNDLDAEISTLYTAIGGTSPAHSPVSLTTNGYSYLSLTALSQSLTLSAISLTTDVSGVLSVSNGGTGINSATAPVGGLLIGNGSGFSLSTLGGDANLISDGTLTLANSGVGAGTYGSLTGIPVLVVDAKGRITSASTSALNLTFENPLTFSNGLSRATNTITVDATTTGTTSTTASNSGLEVSADGVRMLGGCGNNEVLAWNSGNNTWYCTSVGGVGALAGSGTPNYLARFTGTNSLASGSIYDNGTYVGIGTTAPTSTLTVAGGLTLPYGNVLGVVGGTLSQIGSIWGDSGVGGIRFYADGTSLDFKTYDNGANPVSNVIQFSSGSAGSSAYSHGLQSDPTIFIHSNTSAGVATNQWLSLSHNKTSGVIATGIGNLLLSPAGNVGIGTTAPSEKLEVQGNIKANIIYLNGANSSVYTDSSYMRLTGQNGIRFEAGAVEQMRLTTDGLGLGNTAPTYKLDVNGDIRIASGSDLRLGSVLLGGTGSSNTTSGAYKVGSFDEFTYSNSGTVQSVLKDFDTQLGLLYSAVGGTAPSHSPVSLTTNGYSYLSLATVSQTLTMSAVSLTTDVSGVLSVSNGGTGINSATAPIGGLLIGNGSGFTLSTLGGDATLISDGTLTLANSGVGAGTYGSTTGIPVITIDAKGRITSASTTPLSSGGVVFGSGTTNYLARFSNNNTLTTGSIYDSGTNVGIGTTNPLGKLYVKTTDAFVNMLPSIDPVIEGGYESVGVPSIAGQINLYDGGTADFTLAQRHASMGSMIFKTRAAERMRITSLGNVGIGTTAPTYKLDVVGTAYISGALTAGSAITASGYICAANSSCLNGTTGLYYNNNGTGNYKWSTQTPGGANPLLLTSGDGASYTGGYITFQTDGSDKVIISNLGNVGIGTTVPSYKLDVNGDVRIASGSDLRLGSVLLGGTGSSNTTSGAYKVGAFDEFTYSSSATVQGVLKDLDSELSTMYTMIGSSAPSHPAVSLTTNGYSFVSLSAATQTLALSAVSLTSDISGVLSAANGGTGLNAGTAPSGSLLIGKGTGFSLRNISGDASLGVTGILTLVNSGVVADTYGSSLGIPVLTVDSKGRILAASTAALNYENPLIFSDGLSRATNTITVDATTTGTTSTTASNSGLEVTAGGVRMLGGCGNSEVLSWDTTLGVWRCNSVSGIGAISGTGSTNYVSKYLSAGTLGNSIIFDDSSRVGIGTNSPLGTLDVRGGIRLGASALQGNTLNTSIGASAPSGNLYWGDRTLIDTTNIGSYATTAVTAGNGLSGGGSNGALTLDVGAGNGITVAANSISVDAFTAGVTSTTASNSGLEVAADGIRLLGGCGSNQLLVWNNGNSTWECSTVLGAGGLTGTGVNNYVARFTGTNTLTTGVLYDNGTNVGVGTTNPLYLLQAKGVYSDLYFDGGTLATLGTTFGSGSKIDLYDGSTGNMTFTTNYAPSAITFNPGGTEKMRVLNNGYVGIGTTNPQFNLDVVGAIYASSYIRGNYFQANSGGVFGFNQLYLSNIQRGGYAMLAQGGGATALNIFSGDGSSYTGGYINFAIDNTDVLQIANNKNIGIGTTNPLSKLAVNGGVAIGAYAGAATSPVNGLLVSGMVGLGTTVPLSKLSVVGSISGDNLVLPGNNQLSGLFGVAPFVNSLNGFGTAGIQRLTASGNLTNINSIQAGQLNITTGGTFLGVATFPSKGQTAYGVSSGDLNSDGVSDLVTVNATTNSMAVFLGNGSGGFVANSTYPSKSTSPQASTIADVNGDGKLDVIIASNGSNSITVFINNGGGTFASGTTYSTSFQPNSVLAADLNGDGKVDIAVPDSISNVFAVHINNGDGTFRPAVYFSTGNNTTPIISLATADMNADGKLDVISANSGGSGVSVMLSTGYGNFAAATTYPTNSVTPYGLVTADFNNDNNLDVATANYNSNSISILLNTGTGTLGAATTYPAAIVNPYAIAVNDFNSDGKPDLAVPAFSSNAVAVFINTGTGGFAPAVTMASVASNVVGIATGDFNRDGKADIAVANGNRDSLGVFINTASPVLTTLANGNVGIGTTNPTGKLDVNGNIVMHGSTINTVGSINFGPSAWMGQITTAYNAGTDDGSLIFNTRQNGLLYGEAMRISASNVGIGTTLPAYKLDVNGILRTVDLISQELLLGGSGASIISAYKGVNGFTNFAGGIGTGGVDSLLASQRLTSSGNLVNIGSIQAGEMLLSSGGTFVSGRTYPSLGVSEGYSKAADINGDGALDIIARNATSNSILIYLNSGSGTFISGRTYPSLGNGGGEISASDINGDGMLDIIGVNATSNSFVTYIGNGDGTMGGGRTYPSVGLTVPMSSVAKDMNRDGKPDFITVGQGNDTVGIYLNNGDGTFTTGSVYTSLGVNTFSVTTADLNGDGIQDIVGTNYNTNSVFTYINNGDGTLGAGRTYPTTATTPNSVAAADINKDGKTDIAVSMTGSVAVLFSNGDGTLGTAQTYPAFTSFPNNVVFGDINGDGNPDMALATGTPNSITTYINNGVGSFISGRTYPSLGNTSNNVALADINGDNKADIIAGNNGTNSIVTYINQSTPMLYAQASSSFVGIGTTNPDAKLHLVNGDLFVAADNGYTFNNASSLGDIYAQGNLEVDGTIYGTTATLGQINLAGDLIGDFTGQGLITSGTAVSIDTVTTGTTSTTASNSGLEVTADGVRLLGGCSANQVLAWDAGANRWTCTSGPVLGNGVAGRLTFWNGTNNLASNQSLYWNDSEGKLGIGSSNPTAFLQLDNTYTAGGSFSSYRGLETNITNTNGVNISRMYGLSSYPFNSSSSANINYLSGLSIASGTDNGFVSTLSSAEMTSYAGSGSSVTNQYGLYIRVYGDGTVANRYGVYIDDPGNALAANDFGIYQLGAQPNYFAGGIGIGTTVPATNLHIYNTGDAAIYLQADADNAGANDNPYIKMTQDGGTYGAILGLTGTTGYDPEGTATTGARNDALFWGSIAGASRPIQFSPDGTVRVTIGSNGLLGVGSTNPTHGNIDVWDSNKPNIAFVDPSNGASNLDDYIGAVEFYSNDTTGNYADAGQTLAAAMRAPIESALGNAVGLGFWVNNNLTSATEVMRLSSSGFLGLGTTLPASMLHLVNGDMYAASESGYSFNHASALSDIYVQGNLEVDGTIYGTTASLGQVDVAGNVSPTADDSYDLGTASYRWRDLYLGPTSLHISSTIAETGTAHDWKLSIQEAAGASRGNLRFMDGAAEKIVITPSGNLGIGNTNPTEKLSIAGNLAIAGQLQLTGYTSDPTNPLAGAMIFNTNTNSFRCYNGSSWNDCSGATSPATGVLYTTSSTAVASGSYITVTHNQNTTDVLASAMYYDSSTSQYKQIEDSSKTVKQSTSNEWNRASSVSTAPSMQFHATVRDTNLEIARSIDTGTGADGIASIGANTNINLNKISATRSCSDGGDAVNYSVTALTSTSATLSTTPSTGCINPDDEILLINLKGIAGAYGNLGNYETVRVSSVSSNVVYFKTAKTKFYGNNTTDDTNIGTATSNQRVMLQRVPNYTSVTVSGGYSLTASAWDGTKGGVLFFRATGTVSVGGSIHTIGAGFRGGAGGLTSAMGTQGESYVGSTGSIASAANYSAGGGGSPVATNPGGGGGGGGGYATTGTDGTVQNAAGGTGGAVLSLNFPTQAALGSGGGGGGGCNYGAAGAGGAGGGIVLISADSISVSGSIAATGSAGSVTSCGPGGGGGAGGSVVLTANTLTLGSSLVTSTSSGNGSVGKIGINYVTSYTGASSPVATYTVQPYYPYGYYHSPVIATTGAKSYDVLKWDQTLNTYGKVSFQTRSGNSADPRDGTWSSWMPTTAPGSSLLLQNADTHGDWSGTATVADGDVTRNIDMFEDEDEGTAGNLTKISSAAAAYADATISSKDLTNYDYITFWVRASQAGNTVKFGFGEAAATEQEYTVYINQANTWQKVYWDLSAIAAASRNGVTKLRVSSLYGGSNTVYIDNIWAEHFLDTNTGSQITSAPNNYFQYRVIFTTTNTAYNPSLNNISFNYNSGFQLVVVDANNVRLYNYTGQTQNMKLSVATSGAGSLASAWTDAGSYVYTTGYESERLYDVTGTNYLSLANSGSVASLGWNGASNLNINSSGFVGIGMTNASVALDVTGDIEYTGTITDVSDARLKENITPITSSLQKIVALRGYSFNMIGSHQTELGFLAQDVQQVIPEAVKVIDPVNGYLGVNYMAFIPVLSEAVKEQNTQYTQLMDRVSFVESLLNINNETSSSSNSSESTSSFGGVAGGVSTLLSTILDTLQALSLDSSNGALTVSTNLNVLGDATLNNVTITGDLTMGTVRISSLDNSIDVLGASCYNPDTEMHNMSLCETQTLYIQKEVAGNVNILNGALFIEPDGLVTIKGTVTAEKYEVKVNQTPADSAGTGVILTGNKEVTINSSAVTDNSLIFVTSTTFTGGQPLVVLSKNAGQSFVVGMEKSYTTDVKFNWWIIN